MDTGPKAGTVAPDAETVRTWPAAKRALDALYVYWSELLVSGVSVRPPGMEPPATVSVPALTAVGVVGFEHDEYEQAPDVVVVQPVVLVPREKAP
jgi:hypothetical protein